MSTMLSDDTEEHEIICAEEDLHPYEVDEHEIARSQLTGGFAGVMTVYGQEFVRLEFDIPDEIDPRVIRAIIPRVATDSVLCATPLCNKSIVLDLREGTTDPEAAAGEWFDELIDVLRNVGKKTRRKLIKADQILENILDAVATSARPSDDTFSRLSR